MKNLRTIRINKHLNQQTIADYLGIHRVTYTNYENGKREPDMETLKKLAQYLDVSIDYMLGYNNPDPKDDLELKAALSLFRKIKNLPPNKRKIIELLTEDESGSADAKTTR